MLWSLAAFGWTLDPALVNTAPARVLILGDAAETAASVLCASIECDRVTVKRKWMGVVDSEIVAALGSERSWVVRSVPGAPDTILMCVFQDGEAEARYVWYQGKNPSRDGALEELHGQVKALEARNQVLDQRVSELEKFQSGVNKSREEPPRPEVVEAALELADIDRSSKIQAQIHTREGVIPCELYPDQAPLAVANFVALAEGKKPWTKDGTQVTEPLYNGTIFHRIVPQFVIQGGDPLGTGRGGSGEKFPNELNELDFSEAGVLAMANAGPGTNSSQFFITVKGGMRHLEGRHSIFGRCETAVPIAISEAPQAERHRPAEPVVIEKISITR